MQASLVARVRPDTFSRLVAISTRFNSNSPLADKEKGDEKVYFDRKDRNINAVNFHRKDDA